MNFGMITENLCMVIISYYVTWIHIVLLFMLKQMIFTRILVMISINGLIQVIIVKILIDL